MSGRPAPPGHAGDRPCELGSVAGLDRDTEAVEHRGDVGGWSWFTIDDTADPRGVACISRAALSVLRREFTYFGIDAASDAAWPDDVMLGAEYLDERRHTTKRRLLGFIPLQPSITVNLDLKVSEDFTVAMATVPFTIGCTGLNERGQIIYSIGDTGTAASFALTPSQARAVRDEIRSFGGNPDLLIPMPAEN